MPKRATAAESRYMAQVAGLGCVLCAFLGFQQQGRTTVHHIKEGTGIGQRQVNWLTIALCREHHQGATGLHGLGTKGFYTRYRLDELDLLDMTLAALAAKREAEAKRLGYPGVGGVAVKQGGNPT